MPVDPEQDYVRFVNVQKTNDGRSLVIKDLSFSLRRGEFLTLLGPSGSGKTTTLMMLAGFERPSSGEIELAGVPLSRTPAYHRDFGMVFQDYALFPHMSVAENVGFPLAVRKRPRDEIRRRVADALAMVKLDAFGDRRPARLSGGQQQRVALARALVFQPRLLLMDEPLGALDKQLRDQMQIEIKHIQQSLGITAVYVTHDQQEALTMSDRVAVFNDGRICQLDTPDAIYERPATAFVAGFVGENNRLDATVTARDAATCTLVLDSGEVVVATPADGPGEGGRAAVLIRPERVCIACEAAGLANKFDVAVEEILYQGDLLRIRVALGGQREFTIKRPNTGRMASLSEGARITVGWSTQDARAFTP
jgi:putative spermidine/putrescine transport system ATP-binding protein